MSLFKQIIYVLSVFICTVWFSVADFIIDPYRFVAGGDANQTELQDAAIAHYTLDEASGSALDSTANNLDLTDVNTVGATTGQVSGARLFNDAAFERFESDADTHSPAAGFTLITVVQIDDLTVAKAIMSKNAASNFEYYLFVNASEAIDFGVSANGTSYNTAITGTGVITTGAPYFVVAQHRTGTDIRVQITALADSARSASWTTGTNPGTRFNGTSEFMLGRLNAGNPMSGWMDEAGVYDAVISDAALDAYFLKVKDGTGLYDVW